MKIFLAPDNAVELTDWMSDNIIDIRNSLTETGLVLFRGFDTEDAATLKKTLALFGANPMTDARWSTPRSSVGEGALTSTKYPPEQWIVLHSEMSYARTLPRLMLLQCKTAAETGGARTIADLKVVSEAPGDLVDEFREREVIYQRTFRKGIDIPWQNAFDTDDPDEVPEISKRNGLEVDWQNDDLAIIDNMRWMHGRARFTGTRKVLAAMGWPHDTASLTPIFA